MNALDARYSKIQVSIFLMLFSVGGYGVALGLDGGLVRFRQGKVVSSAIDDDDNAEWLLLLLGKDVGRQPRSWRALPDR